MLGMNISLPPHADEFLDSLPTFTSTPKTYGYALRRLAEFMQTEGLSLETTQDWSDRILVQFYQWLLKKSLRAPTCANYMTAAKRYLTWLDSEDRLPPHLSIAKAVARWTVARGGWSYGARAAVRKPDPGVPTIVSYYDNIPLPAPYSKNRTTRLTILRARAIVHTLYSSAGRVGEVAALTREAVHDGKLSQAHVIGKGNKDRLLIFTKEAQQAIAAYCKERDDAHPGLFISHGRGMGRPLKKGTLWRIVKQAAFALGLHKGTSPHSFRHYRAQQLLDEGMDIQVLQAFLGHGSIDVTRRVYAPETSVEKIRDQFDTFGKSASEAAHTIA
jgi:site-specific recombinase XerD